MWKSLVGCCISSFPDHQDLVLNSMKDSCCFQRCDLCLCVECKECFQWWKWKTELILDVLFALLSSQTFGHLDKSWHGNTLGQLSRHVKNVFTYCLRPFACLIIAVSWPQLHNGLRVDLRRHVVVPPALARAECGWAGIQWRQSRSSELRWTREHCGHALRARSASLSRPTGQLRKLKNITLLPGQHSVLCFANQSKGRGSQLWLKEVIYNIPATKERQKS